MVSSTMPSAKYSCSGSPLRLLNGNQHGDGRTIGKGERTRWVSLLFRRHLGCSRSDRSPDARLEKQADPARSLALPDGPSIAVLPFNNLSGDPEQEYFADGIVEDIITALSRIKWFFVIARNSSFTYKGRNVDVKLIARELGVRYVLEGSVRKAGNRVRITGQLIDGSNAVHIWADTFDGTLDQVFDFQDQVTSGVVGVIAPKIEKAEIATRDAKAHRQPRRV